MEWTAERVTCVALAGGHVDSGKDRLHAADPEPLGQVGRGGRRSGVSTETAEKMKPPKRENRELRQANEILKKASALILSLEPMA